jgi:hypothetical protein
MARVNRRRRDEQVPLRSAAAHRVEVGPDGEWQVRQVPGSSATRDYRCPGCDQVVAAGTPHIVAWPAGEHGSVDERRHWHTPCWAARGRRQPGLRRRP